MTPTLHVVFKVGGNDYVLPADLVVQMETFTGATPVPGAAPYVAGLVQIRGKVIPVIDLRARFGLPPIERTLDARVIVVKDGDRQVGLLADSAREVLRLDPDGFKPPPDLLAQQASGFVTAIAQAGPRLVLRVETHALIGAATPEELHHGKKA